MNKKGMDISLNFIILAVLALIALIIIALFFTGGLTNLFKQQQTVGDISGEKLALYASQCKLYCTTNNENSWENPKFAEESLAGKGCGDDYVAKELGLKNYGFITKDGEKECVTDTTATTTP